MDSLKERIEKELDGENRQDLLRLNARLQMTNDILELLRGTFSREAPIQLGDVMGVIEEHRDHDVENRRSLLAGVEDQRTAESESDGFDQLLTKMQPQLSFLQAHSPCPEPQTLNLARMTYSGRLDPEDGGQFDPDFYGHA